jgi:hypothetical protein
MITIHCSIEEVDRLECIFAKLTQDGWGVPSWLLTMRAVVEAGGTLDIRPLIIKEYATWPLFKQSPHT